MGGEKGSFSTSLGGAVAWKQALQTKRFRGFRFHRQLPIGLSLPLCCLAVDCIMDMLSEKNV